MTALLLAAAIVQSGLIFANGFEEGSACAWSNTPPCAVEGFRDHAYSPPGARYWSVSRDLDEGGELDNWQLCWPEIFCTLNDNNPWSAVYGNGTWDFLLPPGSRHVTVEATGAVVVSVYAKGFVPGAATWRRDHAQWALGWDNREEMTWIAGPIRITGTLYSRTESLEESNNVSASIRSSTWERHLFLGSYKGARAALERAAGELAWTMTATPHWTRTAAPGATLTLPPLGDVLRLSNLPLSAPLVAIYEVTLE